MSPTQTVAGVLAWAVALMATPVVAQDSVSRKTAGPCLPGDALSPWDPALPCAQYVVDLVPLTTSWSTEFAIAPIVKSSKSSSAYYSSLISAQSMSRVQQLNVAYPVPWYYEWVAALGYGVHPTQDFTPGTVSPTGLGNRFAVTFAEYSTTDSGKSYNGIVGAVVNYDPGAPTRLYLKRVMTATNSSNSNENRSSFGLGAVDETGDVMFRADGFGCTGPNTLVGNNIFDVDMLLRNCGVVNYVDNNGLADPGAGTWILVRSGTTYNTPNIGPRAVFDHPELGSLFLGTNFSTQYCYGRTNPPPCTTAHRPGTTDHRGNLAYMTQNVPCIGGTYGTAAILSKSNAGGGKTDSISVWGLNADGGVAEVPLPNPPGPLLLTLPVNIVDKVTLKTNMAGANQFGHYASQVAYRGGNSQIGLNVDQAGRLLAAAVVYEPDYIGNDNPLNYIAMARVNGSTCAIEWAMVAYSVDQTGGVGTGKPILGPGGMQIGRLAMLNEIPGAPFGPSMSAPMIDSVGNVWFLSAVYLTHYKDGTLRPAPDPDVALIRAVYDPPIFGYRLELVLEQGEAFLGHNSGVPWQVRFLEIADSDSVGSGTAWSQNIGERAHRGLEPGPGLSTQDPTTLGGLVIAAQIVYDYNGDADFVKCTGTGGVPTSPDEDYNVLLYIGATSPAPSLTAAAPADQSSLWRSAKNTIRLTFDGDITVPAPGEIRIEELGTNGTFGPDLSAYFAFTVENDAGGHPRILRIRENSSVLTHQTWAGIRNTGGWAGVVPFEVQYVVMVGDCNEDKKVTAADLSCIFPCIPTAVAADQLRCDINGDGKVLANDLSVVFPRIPSATPPKPSGH